MSDHDMPDDSFFNGSGVHESVTRLRSVPPDHEPSWRDALIMSKPSKDGRSEPVPCLANAVTFLTEHPLWKGLIGYNAFADRVELLRPAPWTDIERPATHGAGEWTDTDTARAVAWFEWSERLRFGDRILEQAIPIVAEHHAFHPVRDYLKGLKWDSKLRLDDVLATHFSCASTDYTRAIGQRWFVSAVARVMRPGAQVDCTLVLESETQGWYKTSAFRALVPVRNWYSDTGIDIGNKDSMQALHGVWVYGLDELDSLSRGEITRTKTFMTQTVDRYRPPFGRRPRDYPRQNVFVGSTNATEYLTDSTGNRRFWPARLQRPIDVNVILADRDQLWAEALARYLAGEAWHVDTPSLRRLCEAEQAERVQEDGWTLFVSNWLSAPSVTVPDPDDGRLKTYTVDIDKGLTTTEALVGAVRMRSSDINRAHTTRMGALLRVMGFTEVRQVTEGSQRVRRYARPG